MRVFKYEVEYGLTKIKLPKGAEILSIDSQYNAPKIWALVDPLVEEEIRYIYIAMTGNNINPTGLKIKKFIGTFLENKGSFVGHAFEMEESK